MTIIAMLGIMLIGGAAFFESGLLGRHAEGRKTHNYWSPIPSGRLLPVQRGRRD